MPGDVARSHLPGVNRGAGCFGFNCRMVVIFRFGAGSPEDQGEVAPCVCPNCHISQLHQLGQLHNQGVLSDAAYAAAKRRIPEQDKQPQPPGPASPPARPADAS